MTRFAIKAVLLTTTLVGVIYAAMHAFEMLQIDGGMPWASMGLALIGLGLIRMELKPAAASQAAS